MRILNQQAKYKIQKPPPPPPSCNYNYQFFKIKILRRKAKIVVKMAKGSWLGQTKT
jgi:hypothetical protein